MSRRQTGRYERTIVGGETIAAFLPAPLPPAEPPLEIQGALADRLRVAEEALARLEMAGEILPSTDVHVSHFLRKEAVLSCQIEGTQASLADLLRFEAGALPPNDDIEEILGYLRALEHVREELKSPTGLPLSMRLLNQAHFLLMRGKRAEEKEPGEIRRSQNWVGGTRPGNAVFVPPPPHYLPEALSAFEKYIHSEDELPPLVRIGLLHAQFETIHPYLDGNGRVGRLLVTILLEHWGLLRRPLLFLSLFFKWNRLGYFTELGAIRTDGDWEGWLDYFLEGVAAIAERGVNSLRDLERQVAKDRAHLLQRSEATTAELRLFERLREHPVVTIASVADDLQGEAGRAIESLVEAKILTELPPNDRPRAWSYRRYLEILRIGTDI